MRNGEESQTGSSAPRLPCSTTLRLRRKGAITVLFAIQVNIKINETRTSRKGKYLPTGQAPPFPGHFVLVNRDIELILLAIA